VIGGGVIGCRLAWSAQAWGIGIGGERGELAERLSAAADAGLVRSHLPEAARGLAALAECYGILWRRIEGLRYRRRFAEFGTITVDEAAAAFSLAESRKLAAPGWLNWSRASGWRKKRQWWPEWSRGSARLMALVLSAACRARTRNDHWCVACAEVEG